MKLDRARLEAVENPMLTPVLLSYQTVLNCVGFVWGGGGGIRTHGDLTTTPVFKTGAFNRSATPPLSQFCGFFDLWSNAIQPGPNDSQHFHLLEAAAVKAFLRAAPIARTPVRRIVRRTCHRS